MTKGFFSLFKQDLIITWRNKLVLVTLITLVVMVTTYWILPLLLKEEISIGRSLIFLDHTEGSLFTKHLSDPEGNLFAEDQVDLESRVNESSGLIGIIVEGPSQRLQYTLIFKNKPNQEAINILKAVLRDISADILGESYGTSYRIDRLRLTGAPVPPNKRMIAILLAFEVMILGFLFIAVVVFGEKKEGSLGAYRVSPSGLINYIASKTFVFSVLSILYGLALVFTTIGCSVNYLMLTIVLLLSCTLMTLFGLGIAMFFNTLSEWFVVGVLILSINMLSILPYQIPTYSSRVLTFLPGYSVIFGVSEILYPTGEQGFLGPLVVKLQLQILAIGVFSFWSVRRNMLREVS